MVEDSTPKPSDWSLYLRLLAYVYAYWPYFLLSVVGFLIYSATAVLMADLMQLIIDTAGGKEQVDVGMIARFLVWWQGSVQTFLERARILIPFAMFVIVVLRGAGFLIGNYYINYVARFLVHKLRCEVFDHLLLVPSAYYDRHSSGHLLSRITFNVEQVTGAATNAIKIIMREGLTVIGLLAFLVYTNWKLSLVFIAIAPVIAVIVSSVGKLFRRYSKRIQSSVGDVTHVADEAINGYREVRMYDGNAYEQQRFYAASEYNRRQSMKMALTNAASPPVIQLLVAVAMGVLVWLMLPPSSLGNLTSGQLVAFLTAAGMLAKPIRQLSEVLGIVQKGLAAAEDIFAYLDSDKERDLGDYH
ncbi:MAG: ABC transporter transmembrane domain-containing protein, partial [Pseudomonadales bacterium]